jgi:hypothetical protein
MEFAARKRAVDPPVEQTGQDYFSLHAGKYIWMHHELCGFAIGAVESHAPDVVILAPAERQMFCAGK